LPLPYAITIRAKKGYTAGIRDFVAIDAFWRMILAIDLFVLFASVVGIGVALFQR